MVRVTKRWAVPGALAAGALLLAGCSSTEVPSAAAVVGAEEIPLTELDDQLREINEVRGAPDNRASPQVTQGVLTVNVWRALVAQTAESMGLSVTETQVQEQRADLEEFNGGPDALLQVLAEIGFAPSIVEEGIRTELLTAEIVAEVSQGASLGEAEEGQILFGALRLYGEEAGVTVNPRFGYWDWERFGITEDPNAPARSPQSLEMPGLP